MKENSKSVNTRLRIVRSITIITLVTGCGMRLFDAVYFLRKPESFFSGIAIFVGIILVGSLITCLILWILVGPLFSLLKRQQREAEVSLAERIAARKRLNHVPLLLIVANMAGFLAGSLVSLLLSADPATPGLDSLNVGFLVFLDLVVGLMTGIQEAAMCDGALLRACEQLALTRIDQGARDASLQSRLVMATVGAVLLATTLCSMAAIGFYREIATWATTLTTDTVASASVSNQSAVQGNVFTVIWQMGLLGGILCLWAFGLIAATVSGLKRELNQLSTRMGEISSGTSNLGQRASIVFFDEIGQLTHDINGVLNHLQSLVGQVKATSEQVGTAAERLGVETIKADNAVEDLNHTLTYVQTSVGREVETVKSTSAIIAGLKQTKEALDIQMQNQAALIDDSSSSITEIASNISSVSTMTTTADQLAGSLATASDNGGRAVTEMIAAIQEIDAAATQVSGIVTVISRISAQTNLLAMNAAIEAAHAGNSGAGFAVVADEVRKLAETSTRSARDIIAHIRAMEAKITTGVELAQNTGLAFQSINQDIMSTGRLIQTIAQSMNEQKAGADLILTSIAKLTESSSVIKQLAAGQSADFSAMDSAMAEIVLHTKDIEKAVAAQEIGARTLGELIARVRTETEANSHQVELLQATVNGFEI